MSRPKPSAVPPIAKRRLAVLSIDERLKIDELASDFESKWNTSSQQKIEQVLLSAENDHLSQSARSELFQELLLIEMELLDRAGQPFEKPNYMQRFPGFYAEIEAASQQYRPLPSDRNARRWSADAGELSFSRRYFRDSEIARGGMGIVYHGFDRMLRRPVAIKVLDPQLMSDEEAVKRFRREPINCGNLQHPNIVPIYDSGMTEEGLPYFVMKLIGGRTLEDLLSTAQVETGSEAAIEIFQQVCHAIAAAHRQGVIHRDIKPSNIMVADLGEVYVMDWGLSGILRGTNKSNDATSQPALAADPLADGDHSVLTNRGTLFGTPRYMPPEFRSDSADRSNKLADVYCLGSVLCELMVGKTPHQILESATEADRESKLRKYLLAHQVDEELSNLILACVQHDPMRRPETADVVVEKLEHHRSNVRNRVRKAELDAQRFRHESRINTLRFRIGAVVLCGLLIIAGVASWAWNQKQARRTQQMATASRTLTSAQIAFSIACKSETWDSPQWQYVQRLLDVAVPEVQACEDVNLKTELAELQKQASLLNGIRDAITLKTDLKNNRFYYDDKEGKVREAFVDFGIDIEAKIEQTVERLSDLPIGAKKMIIEVLTEMTGSNRYQHQQYWNRLTPALEQEVLGTNLATALASHSIDRLRECMKPENLQRYLPESLDTLGTELLTLGEDDLAEAVFRFACSKYPDSFDLNTSFGNYLANRYPHEPVKAMPFLAVASAVDPKPGALLNYASCLSDCGELELADNVLQKVVRENPDYYFASILWANCKKRLGDEDASIKILEDSLKRGNHYAWAPLNLAQIYRRRNHFRTAEKYFFLARQRILEDNDLTIMDQLFELGAALGFIRQTADDVRDVLQRNPDAKNLYYSAGLVHSDLMEFDQAIDYYREDLKFHPTNAMSVINIGFCLTSMGRFEEALDYYVKGHELGAESENWQFPSGKWVEETEANTKLLETLDAVLNQLRDSKDNQRCRALILDVLIPAGKWSESFDLCIMMESDDSVPDGPPSSFLRASEIAMRALIDDAAGKELNKNGLKQSSENALMASKACQWLAEAAERLFHFTGDDQQLAEELYSLRLFLQSSQSDPFKNAEGLEILQPEQRSAVRTALDNLLEAEKSLLAKLK